LEAAVASLVRFNARRAACSVRPAAGAAEVCAGSTVANDAAPESQKPESKEG